MRNLMIRMLGAIVEVTLFWTILIFLKFQDQIQLLEEQGICEVNGEKTILGFLIFAFVLTLVVIIIADDD